MRSKRLRFVQLVTQDSRARAVALDQPNIRRRDVDRARTPDHSLSGAEVGAEKPSQLLQQPLLVIEPPLVANDEDVGASDIRGELQVHVIVEQDPPYGILIGRRPKMLVHLSVEGDVVLESVTESPSLPGVGVDDFYRVPETDEELGIGKKLQIPVESRPLDTEEKVLRCGNGMGELPVPAPAHFAA